MFYMMNSVVYFMPQFDETNIRQTKG